MEPRIFIIETEDQQARFASFIAKQKGLPIEVGVKDYIPKRTIAQNARLWKLHGMAAEVTGYTVDEMHNEALCNHYGYAEKTLKNPYTGQVECKKRPLKRSSGRDKKDFAKFMTATENWYAENLGIWLNPEE